MLTAPNTPKTYRVPASSWLPQDDAANLREPIKTTFTFSKPERVSLRKLPKMQPSKWAPKHRKIVAGATTGQMFDMQRTPHLAGILDAAALPFVHQIAMQAAPQTGKTTCADTFHLWTTVYDPGPILSIYPNETTGTRAMKKRIQEVYKQSPQLADLRTGRREDESNTHIQLTSALWEIGWGGSATSLADRSERYVDCQEVDKYGETVNKKEAGVIELAEIRTRDYKDNYNLFITSSPSDETGEIHIIITSETEAVFVPWVHCPYCTHEQQMLFSRDTFVWPKDEDGHSVDRKRIKSKKLGRYVCTSSSCHKKWDDDTRDQAVQSITWRIQTDDGTKGEELFRHLYAQRPATIGFIVPSWISTRVSLSEVCHDFLRCSDPNLSPEKRFTALKNFKNKQEAQIWRWIEEEKPVETVLNLKDDRPVGLVPGNNQVAGLVAGVDTQGDGFWFWIMAVGYGQLNQQWLIRCGFVDSWAALETVLWEHEYCDPDGNVFPVMLSMQDSGGNRTGEVYEFCANNRGKILPIKGQQTMKTKFSVTNLDTFPNSNKPIPGGLQLYNINTKYYKDYMAIKLGVKAEEPGCIRFHAEFGDDHAAQLIAETRNQAGFWEQIGSRANHLWDCWEYAWVAADYLGLRHMAIPTAETEPEEDDELETFESDFMSR